MTSPIRSGMFASLLLGLFLAFVVAPQGAHSFAPTPQSHGQQTRSVLLALDDDQNAFMGDSSSPPPPKPVKCPDCTKCDGSGRIEGGIGTVLKFWPIKCYRPCPDFIERGGFYTRAGQGLDEIAFGADSRYDPME